MENEDKPSNFILELEKFYYDMGEDWHLWDEEQYGSYPVERIFSAWKKFIEVKKEEQNNN